MSIEILSAFSEKSPDAIANEDRIGSMADRNAAWVIDGGTSLNKVPNTNELATDAEWHAHYLNMRITDVLSKTTAAIANPTVFFGKVLDLVQADFAKAVAPRIPAHHDKIDAYTPDEVPHYEPPSSAAMFMQYRPRTHSIDFYGLGDCSAIVMEQTGSIAQFSFTTSDIVSREARRAEQIRNGQQAKLDEERTIMRNSMNKPGGKPIFSTHPEAAIKVKHHHIDLRDDGPAHVLLMTDGFSRLHDTFKLYSPGMLINTAMDLSLNKLGSVLREQEREQGMDEVSRLKTHDDMSAVLIRTPSRRLG